jgi:hypothetical protein
MAGARRSLPTTWVDYYEREIQEGRCGSIQSYSGLAISYLDDVPGLGQLVDDKDGEGVLLVAGAGKTIRLLHQVFEDAGRGRVLGLSGTQRYAPLKELLVRSSRATRQKVTPSFKEFTNMMSPEGFAALEGSSDTTIGDMTAFPQSAWTHPALITGHLVNGIRVASTGYSTVRLTKEEGQDETEEKYYNLMLFLWAIEQGLVQPKTLHDPPTSITVNNRLVVMNWKLESLPPTGTDDDEDTGDRNRSP